MSELTNIFREHKAMVVGTIVLLIGGIFAFLRAGQVAQMSDLEMELNSELDKINLNSKHAESIYQDTLTLEGCVDSIEERLFVGEERSTNIDFFYSFEEKLNITISEVKQLESDNARFSKGGPDAMKLYSTVSYNITLGGTFQEILRFLYEIHQIDSIMRVTELEIDVPSNRSPDTDSDQKNWDISNCFNGKFLLGRADRLDQANTFALRAKHQ